MLVPLPVAGLALFVEASVEADELPVEPALRFIPAAAAQSNVQWVVQWVFDRVAASPVATPLQ